MRNEAAAEARTRGRREARAGGGRLPLVGWPGDHFAGGGRAPPTFAWERAALGGEYGGEYGPRDGLEGALEAAPSFLR